MCATEGLSQNDLDVLRQELEISDDESNSLLNSSGSGTKMVIGTTCSKQCTQERTLEDAIWKESTSEFLIVDDNILNMPDCCLSIKSLSDREIEIQLDPKLRERTISQDPLDHTTEPIQTEDSKGDEILESDNKEQEEDKQSEIETKDTETVKPKMKIGTGKQRKRSRAKAKSSSESDTPRYSMRIRLTTGGHSLRTQITINYQETYDYRTGKSTSKPKDPIVPAAAISAPTAARQAAQVAIKDPSLLGATPSQTIPVLILHNNMADDSDNTIVYEETDTTDEVPTPVADPDPEPVGEPVSEKDKPKTRGSLRFKHYVIRWSKQRKKTKKYKCSNRYDCVKTLNRHFCKRYQKIHCVDCGKLCSTPELLRHHAYDHSLGDRFSCKYCREKFVFKSYLKVHMLKHKGKPTFTCPIVNCNKKFTYKGELARHSKEHDNITWTCRRCNYDTDTKRKLNQHMNIHLQRKKYTCKFCGKKFVHSMQLVRHYVKCAQNPENME